MKRKLAPLGAWIVALSVWAGLVPRLDAQSGAPRPVYDRHGIPVVTMPASREQSDPEVPLPVADPHHLPADMLIEPGLGAMEPTHEGIHLGNQPTWDPWDIAFIPNMLGDFIGGFIFGPPPPPDSDPRAFARTLNRFKVADNNSPFPRTRFLYSYNYFHDAFNTQGEVHRNFFGGEYAFFEDRMSFELRTSVNYFEGFDNLNNETDFGQLLTTFKALIRRTDSMGLSAGMAIGWPIHDNPGSLPDANYYFMPFVAGLIAPPTSNWFLQAFQQLDIPTQNKDQMVLHTDLGLGYFMWKNDPGFVTSLAPTAELHLYTPVGGAAGGLFQSLAYNDVLNATVGLTAVLAEQMTAAFGFGFPISNEKDYDFEVQAHLNWYFGGTRR